MKLLDKLFKDNPNSQIQASREYWDMFKRITYKSVIPNWTRVEKNSVASEDGVYVFQCVGDNHDIYEAHELKAGESLHIPFTGEHQHGDGWWPVVVPMSYKVIPCYNPNNLDWKKPSRQPQLGDDMSLFNDGGFVVIALKVNGKKQYYDQENCPYIDIEYCFDDNKTNRYKDGLRVMSLRYVWNLEIPADAQDSFAVLGFYTMT